MKLQGTDDASFINGDVIIDQILFITEPILVNAFDSMYCHCSAHITTL